MTCQQRPLQRGRIMVLVVGKEGSTVVSKKRMRWVCKCVYKYVQYVPVCMVKCASGQYGVPWKYKSESAVEARALSEWQGKTQLEMRAGAPKSELQ